MGFVDSKNYVDFHNKGMMSDGFVSIFNLENSYEKIYRVTDKILSEGVSYLPQTMLGHNGAEFGMVESILKNHYDGKVGLNYGLFNVGKLFGQAGFKVKNN